MLYFLFSRRYRNIKLNKRSSETFTISISTYNKNIVLKTSSFKKSSQVKGTKILFCIFSSLNQKLFCKGEETFHSLDFVENLSNLSFQKYYIGLVDQIVLPHVPKASQNYLVPASITQFLYSYKRSSLDVWTSRRKVNP